MSLVNKEQVKILTDKLEVLKVTGSTTWRGICACIESYLYDNITCSISVDERVYYDWKDYSRTETYPVPIPKEMIEQDFGTSPGSMFRFHDDIIDNWLNTPYSALRRGLIDHLIKGLASGHIVLQYDERNENWVDMIPKRDIENDE